MLLILQVLHHIREQKSYRITLSIHMTRYAKYRNNREALLHDDPPLSTYPHRGDHIPRDPISDLELPRICSDTWPQALCPRRIRHHRSRALHIHRAPQLDTRDICRGNVV